jgi:hypothetical protein
MVVHIRAWQWVESNLKPGLPPGTGWPSVVQTIALLWFMERWVRWGHRRLGAPRTVKVLGLGGVVSVWRPDLVKELFTGDSDVLPGVGSFDYEDLWVGGE